MRLRRLQIISALLLISLSLSAQRPMHKAWTGKQDTISVNSLSSIKMFKVGAVYQSGGNSLTLFNDIINDNHTKLWYDYTNDSTIVKTKNKVISFIDVMGTGNNLNQADTSKSPTFSEDGLVFDGVNDYLKTVAFTTLSQPIYYYIVFKQKTWTLYDNIIDGNSSTNRTRIYQYDNNPEISMFAGDVLVTNSTYINLDSLGIIRCLFNGDSSMFRMYKKSEFTGNAGNYGISSLTVGANYNGTSGHSNIVIKEIIVRDTIDSDIESNIIYSYLADKYRKYEETFNKGKIVFTFDDFEYNNYTEAFPLFVNRAIKATFYMYPNLIDATNRWDEVAAMYNDGFDFQCHSFYHTKLSELNESELVTELTKVDSAFTAHGFAIPQHLAYPLGAYNDSVIVWLKRHDLRKTARLAAGNKKLFYRDEDRFRIGCYGIDNISDLAELKTFIDNCKKYKAALFLYSHGVTETGDAYSVSTEKLNEIIDYIESIGGIDIVTMKQLYNLM
jgi:peptidoglycan/xylan/chitin deacetylase (PgdA/CDA1 family)